GEPGFRTHHAIDHQSGTLLEGAHGALGGGAEMAVWVQARRGAQLVEAFLQLEHGQAAVVEAQSHRESTLRSSRRLAAARLASTPNRPTMQAKKTPACGGAPISDGP